MPAPFDKGACGQCPLTISHGGFQQLVTSLTRPVSAAGVPPGAIPHGNLQQIVTAPPAPGNVPAVEVGVSITSIKYRPIPNHQLSARWLPQSPAVTAPSRRELWGAYFSTLDLWELEVPAMNPSVKNQRFLPAPFSKGACGQCPLTISHGGFLRFVTSLTRPVSFYGATPGFFRLSIDSVGTKNLKIQQTQTGAEAKTHHLSQSEGSIPVGSSRGILKGGTIRAGASCSPLVL